jgi:hypothetical protein
MSLRLRLPTFRRLRLPMDRELLLVLQRRAVQSVTPPPHLHPHLQGWPLKTPTAAATKMTLTL